jgi:hypothetical protein
MRHQPAAEERGAPDCLVHRHRDLCGVPERGSWHSYDGTARGLAGAQEAAHWDLNEVSIASGGGAAAEALTTARVRSGVARP